MSDVYVPRFSKDGLRKEVFEFDYESGALRYTSHRIYNRSSKKDTWADEEREKTLSFEAWCRKLGKDEYGYWSEREYDKYRNKRNPVMQKTKQGKVKMSGIYAMISHMPLCPDDVAEEAKILFAKGMKVVYKAKPGTEEDEEDFDNNE